LRANNKEGKKWQTGKKIRVIREKAEVNNPAAVARVVDNNRVVARAAVVRAEKAAAVAAVAAAASAEPINLN
jgi:hypothetical protein